MELKTVPNRTGNGNCISLVLNTTMSLVQNSSKPNWQWRLLFQFVLLVLTSTLKTTSSRTDIGDSCTCKPPHPWALGTNHHQAEQVLETHAIMLFSQPRCPVKNRIALKRHRRLGSNQKKSKIVVVQNSSKPNWL